MDAYTDYQEFLGDLIEWGDGCINRRSLEQEKQSTEEAFLRLLQRAELGIENSVFSPFLYIVLAARLTRQEAMFLAAVLYCGLSDTESRFTYGYWQRFWKQGDEDFPGSDLFYHVHPLLFDREWDEAHSRFSIRMVPQVFLFLAREVLEEQKIPGMRWYYRYGDELPFLGESLRKYHRIASCMEHLPGKVLCYLHGRKGSGRKLNYAYLAAKQGRSMAVARYADIRSEQHLRDVRIECLLHHAILVLELPEKAQEALPSLLYWMEAEDALFLIGEQEEILENDLDHRRYLPFAIDEGAVLLDRELFERISGEYTWEQESDRQEFLHRYGFLPGTMRYILELAQAYALAEGKAGITAQNLHRAMLRSGKHSLRDYAKKVPCIYTLTDLILPEKQKEKIGHILSRVRNRKLVYEEWGFSEKSAYGNGVSMIFAGPPGTGKTMAAQVIAVELGMELYRVELSSVIDKYIGETEKKLNRIFEEAKDSMSILFFDEADVLFGKRTEIRESNDRYSNMEIAFLLQKMEEYEGISILATNYLQNFDEAFRRRISEIIDFPIPDAALREKMWHTMIPEKLPVSSEIDFQFLARQFPMTGSVIKNALLYGCFLAAEAGQGLGMIHILKGIAHELEKSGRILNRQDYGEYYHIIESG